MRLSEASSLGLVRVGRAGRQRALDLLPPRLELCIVGLVHASALGPEVILKI